MRSSIMPAYNWTGLRCEVAKWSWVGLARKRIGHCGSRAEILTQGHEFRIFQPSEALRKLLLVPNRSKRAQRPSDAFDQRDAKWCQTILERDHPWRS
jgi:hypothetical protein